MDRSQKQQMLTQEALGVMEMMISQLVSPTMTEITSLVSFILMK